MALQLRATRAGTAILRFTAGGPRTLPCSAPSSLHSISSYGRSALVDLSLSRSASTYSQSGRSNGFGFKQRDKREQDGRKSYERTPPTKFGMQKRGSEKGDADDRPQRRQSNHNTDRPSYRSSSAQGETRTFDKSDRPSTYGESAYKGRDKTYTSEKRSYNGSNAASRPDQASKGYTRNDRSYGKFRRDNDEAGQADGSPPSKKPTEIERRLRIRPGTSPYDASVHLNNFIRNSRNSKTSGQADAQQSDYLEVAEEILKTAPKESINVAVWNVLLSGFAKERKYQRMFKAFNDMKKRGIRPSSRTYAIMLDNYPASFDSPAKTLSKATLLYDQAQEHVQGVLDQIAEAKESEGYELSSDRPSSIPTKHSQSGDVDESAEEEGRLTIDAYTSGNAVAPTNAYLAQMSHFSQFDEVKRVYEAMPKEGPMAPDGKTYTILFEANLAFGAKQRSNDVSAKATPGDSVTPSGVPAKETKQALFDPIALWKEIVDRDSSIRQKNGKRSGQRNLAERSGPRLMDEQQAPLIDDRLVITALRCFMAGPLEQRTFALEEIVPSIYKLSAPGRSTYSSVQAITPSAGARFEITERAVETILKLCLASGRAREGVHYAEQILNMPKAFTDQLGLSHYNAILALYSKENDIDKCLEILDIKPPFLRGQAWSQSSWVYALKAARFAGNWDKFMIAFKRMTRLPAGFETGKQTSPPIGSGEVDDQISSLLLTTATETKRVSAMRDAMRVFAYYYAGRTPATPSTDENSTFSRYWRRQLLSSAESCLSTIENAGQDASNGRDVTEERAWRDLINGLGASEKEGAHASERAHKPERTRTHRERKGDTRQPRTIMHGDSLQGCSDSLKKLYPLN